MTSDQNILRTNFKTEICWVIRTKPLSVLKLFLLYHKKPFGTIQFGKIGVLVNVIIQKLKCKHLVCLSLVSRFYEETRENILHMFRALVLSFITDIMQPTFLRGQ